MRKSGLLLALPSLPSRWGIGGMGAEADAFADFLSAARQSLWQVLPLTIPDFVHSPYASPSAFAGDPMLIDIPALAADGLLSKADAAAPAGAYFSSIAYDFAYREKHARLRTAYRNFCAGGEDEAYRDFCRREADWLEDFALFEALKAHFGGAPYWQWPDEEARLHVPDALERCRETLAEEIGFRRFTQFLFDIQLKALRTRLAERGIRLIGDIPFYVARDSADVWAHPEYFCLRDDLSPRLAAGVPPDFFAVRGQLWGNPIYDWDRMAADGYRFWMRRLARCAEMYDITRLDHFRALDSYFAVRGGASDAMRGRWRRGPGRAFFTELRRRLPDMRLIAEDLGELSDSVHRLRRQSGLPGMRVLQFAFGEGADNAFLPHNYDRETVCYLGTHDNDTTAGWWRSLDDAGRAHAARYLGISPASSARAAVRRMMAAASASAADTVIFTVQDLSAAGSRARINTPSQIGGCWEYAAPPGFASDADAAWLRDITEVYGRG